MSPPPPASWRAVRRPIELQIVRNEPATVSVRNTRRESEPRSLTVKDVLAQLRPHPAFVELEEQVEVAGETHHARGVKAAFRSAGAAIQPRGTTIDDIACALVPEPWNPYDRNAVAVLYGPHQVGYLPAEDAVEYAPPLGDLALEGYLIMGIGRLWAKSDNGIVWSRATLLIPTVDAVSELVQP